jgi:hypothetical protein
MSGDCGPPYTSAVSKKLTPASIAVSITAKLLGSSAVNPKLIVSSPTRLTNRPERPKRPYVTSSSFAEHTYRSRSECPGWRIDASTGMSAERASA